MANETLNVILKLVTGNYKTEAAAAARATAGIGAAAQTSTGGIGRLATGINLFKGALVAASASRFIGELKEMGQAAADDAQAQELLANALRINVGATDTMIASNERWISSMQIATATADNDLRQAIQDLTVAGRTLEQSQGDVAIALDIAASKGIELSAVIKALVRAQASGSNAGLARLGIETKNAAGEMLAYDEVLKNASETMGGTAARAAGTLAGALERSRVAMEEAREEAGANFSPVMLGLTDLWNGFVTAIMGGDTQLAELQTKFNFLIAQGINPFENQLAAAIAVLKEMNEVDLSAGTLDTLIVMLGLTSEQVLELRRALLQSDDAFGMNEEAAARLNTLLDDYVGNVDPAVLATRRFLKAQEDSARGTRDFTDALEEQRNLLREMASPFFALIGAQERLTEANRALNEIMAEGDTTSMEYQGAIGDLLRAQMEFNIAQAEAAATGESAIGVFEGLAAQAGINEGAFLTWAEAVDILAASIARLPSRITTTGGSINTVTGSPDRPGAFASGGVVPGPRGSPQLILAHAGETVLPTHKPGFNLPSFADGGVVGEKRALSAGGVVSGQSGSPQLILAHAGETILPTHKPARLQSFAKGGVVGVPSSQITIQSFADGGVVGGSWSSQTMLVPTQNMMVGGSSKSVTFNLPVAEGPVKPLDLQYMALLANHMTLLD